MKILFVILAVILLVAVLLLLVLLSPLSVRVIYEDGVVVKAGISFIKIKIFPKKEKNKKSGKEKKKVKSEKTPQDKHVLRKKDNKEPSENEKGKAEENKTEESKNSVKDTVTLVYDIVKSVFDMLGKNAKIRIDALKVVVSRPDAADTAVQFGLCSGVVSSLLAFTSNFGKAVIKDKNISVEPDFISGKSKIELDITLSAGIIYILSSLIKGYFKNQTRK